VAPPGKPASRRAALAVWVAMLALPLAFLGVSEAVARPRPGGQAAGEVFFWLALATSALGIALSRVLPRRLAPGGGNANPEVLAFTRLALGWALVDGVAMFPLVARMVAPDPRLLGVFAVDLLALLTLFPSQGRWAGLARHEEEPARPAER